MSKITPKNLSYDTSLPPFLARLQANNASNDGRNEYHAARPKKARDADADKEDEPVYFDEESAETLTRGEWEERERGKVDEEKDEGRRDGEEEGKDGEKREREEVKIASIGGGRKRKAGKVVGDDGDGESVALKSSSTQKTSSSVKVDGKSAEKISGKAAKKGKKIKLSFGDDE